MYLFYGLSIAVHTWVSEVKPIKDHSYHTHTHTHTKGGQPAIAQFNCIQFIGVQIKAASTNLTRNVSESRDPFASFDLVDTNVSGGWLLFLFAMHI